MGQLHDRMEQDLILRGLRPTTRRNYLLYCRKFAQHFHRSPEEMGQAEIRQFLLSDRSQASLLRHLPADHRSIEVPLHRHPGA